MFSSSSFSPFFFTNSKIKFRKEFPLLLLCSSSCFCTLFYIITTYLDVFVCRRVSGGRGTLYPLHHLHAHTTHHISPLSSSSPSRLFWGFLVCTMYVLSLFFLSLG
ncbi:hypothetical protein BU24DRAFT_227364 [Aaosphaeria arxii CBS 175.79]|uniref:Uncharacterized protein n=1 Tax=Aaosphaeria arxii CBS 175.79 TaxID=1450172 RepID=A0A6A5XQ71_9PLEO|nr:uncharacterized protein BU24DRAFT_227364 [Aaosphaeria arxii CBS 175.79]KAF2015039.1 hypothetical protein BU24DRAFT_227364 [Aaosphaeria arxii CBS 175.79]